MATNSINKNNILKGAGATATVLVAAQLAIAAGAPGTALAQEKCDAADLPTIESVATDSGNNMIATATQQENKDETDDALDRATEAAAEAEAELNSTSSNLAQANQAAESASTAHDAAQAATSEAKADLNAAQAAKEKADSAAAEAQAKADAETANSAAAIKSAQGALAEAEGAKQAADKNVEEAQATVDAINKNAEASNEQAKQGILGAIDWMLGKSDLSAEQTRDLTAAKKIIQDAQEEDFSHWYGGENVDLAEGRNGKVTVIGDEKDATSLTNVKRAIVIMKRINELRASDNNFTGAMQRNDSLTNFYIMAIAATGADRGAGLLRHSSLKTNCENLAFGYSDPNAGWYTQEKKVFDSIKNQLGITELTSETLRQIEAEAAVQGVTIGHYTNLFWAVDQAMGVGFTQYNATSCYNASKASNYTNTYAMYSIEEFEALINDYQAYLAKASEGLDEAQTALDAAIDHQTNAVAAVTAAQDALAAAEAAVPAANETLAAAIATKEQATAELQQAQDAYNAAVSAEAAAKAELDAANVEVGKHTERYVSALLAYQEAKQNLQMAQAAYDAAHQTDPEPEPAPELTPEPTPDPEPDPEPGDDGNEDDPEGPSAEPDTPESNPAESEAENADEQSSSEDSSVVTEAATVALADETAANEGSNLPKTSDEVPALPFGAAAIAAAGAALFARLRKFGRN